MRGLRSFHGWTIRTFRQITSSIRMLPDFLIIGAPKAGTTSLYSYLSKHRQIKPAMRKEVLFFDRKYGRGLRFYKSFFPLWTLGAEAHHRITGEATPYCLQHPLAPKRVADTIPHVKLIALLRDPVDRAWSHYCHNVRHNRETLSFAEALDAEPSRATIDRETMHSDDNYFPADFLHYSYVQGGMYAQHLENWAEHFDLQTQLLIIQSERFFREPIAAINEVASFLEIPEFDHRDFAPQNVGVKSKEDPDTMTRLQQTFGSANERLFDMIGRRFEWKAE